MRKIGTVTRFLLRGRLKGLVTRAKIGDCPYFLLLAAAFASALGAQPLDPKEAELLAPTQKPLRKPVLETTTPVEKESVERFRVLRSSMRPEKRSEEELKLRALEGFLDYDDEEGIIYNPQRTQIVYGRFFLEADRVIIDNRLKEVQAEGNVVLRTNDANYGDANVLADSMRFNFGENEGVAFNVSGKYGPLYFKTEKPRDDREAKLAPFQQVSQEESLFRNTSVSTCNFKVPHYRIRAREVILFTQDRVFFRGATFYVMDVPVMYLPFYTRSVREPSPWFIELGAGKRTGPRMRIGYQYEHETKEPKLDNDEQYETRSSGQARTFADFLSERGVGAGFDYRYSFDFERHKGEFQAYGVEDFKRKVGASTLEAEPNDKNEAQRWALLWKNRTQVTDHLSAQVDVDWFSDPEIFYDILDRFVDRDSERERLPERRARAAVTYLREAYVARLLVEAKDRIGLDRFGNYSNPTDNNHDFDLDPGSTLEKSDANSISSSRWGRVTERLPELTLATRYLPLGRRPLYLLSEIRAYNNLDKGINILDRRDDSFVRGVDVYHQLLWQYRITERYVLLAKVGAGLGVAQRQDDSLGLTLADLKTVDSINLADDDGTFLIGRKKFNLDDIKPFYAYGDAALRFNARFSDALTGFIQWRYRQTTKDFVGDFHAKIGDVTSREDLFDYRLREHWLTANLTYMLLHPSLVTFAGAGANLIGQSERFPNEELGYWNVGARWGNQRQTLGTAVTFGQSRRQVFAPSDPNAGEQDFSFYRADLGYTPIHGRWYVRLSADRTTVGGNTFESSTDQFDTFFTDETDRTTITAIYGRELGPKWNTELRVRWDSRVQGLREVAWLLQRDLHDASAFLRVRSRQTIDGATSQDNLKQELDITYGLKFKLPEHELTFGAGETKTLRQRERQPVVAY